jgi:ABC-type transport system substrate-binding protein
MQNAISVAIRRPGLLTACVPGAPSAGPAPALSPAAEQRAEQQVLSIAAAGLVSAPIPAATGGNAYMLWALYDNLISLGKNYTLRPSIAERWELLPDGSTWRFQLRKDLTWPNGEKLTAADVDSP